MIWQTVKLGDVLEIVRGGSPRPIQDFITEDEDGLNWIKIGDVNEGDKFITKTKEKIKKTGLSYTRMVFEGDFLLSNSMSFGRPYISKITGCIHDGWLMLRDVNNNFNNYYLYHMLSSSAVSEQFKKFATGAVVKNLNKEVVSKVLVPLPSLGEQKHIAAILDKANEIKVKRQLALIKLDELANSAFEEICNESKNNKNFKLKDLVVKKSIKDANHKQVFNLTLDKIESNTGEINDVEFIEKSELGTSTYYFEAPVILFSKLRPYLNKVAYPQNSGYATTELVPLYCNSDRIAPYFLLTYLRSKSFVEFANLNSGGAKMPRVMMDKFWSHEVAVPPMKLQLKFCELFESIQDQKLLLRNDLLKLEKINKSLQNQAFTTGFNA